jgi:cell division septum initiation protein DivIVA
LSDLIPDYIRLKIDELMRYKMSELSDKLDALKLAQDAAVVRVQEDVENLQDQIDDLRQRVTTADDIAKIDEMQAVVDALDPLKPEVLP